MKKALFVFLIVLLIPFIVKAQLQGPNISFETITHDFGKINEQAGPVTYQFKFSNTGSQPLIIQNVKASCGCTSPEWSRQPILPGESGFVAATYNPANRPGPFQKTIEVTANTAEPKIILVISGDVTPTPRSIADEYPFEIGSLRLKQNHIAFPKIFNTETQTQTIDIVNTSQLPLTLSFEGVPEHIQVKAIPETLDAQQTGIIQIEYNAKKTNAWDYKIDNFKLKINNEVPVNPRISVSATIVEDFSQLTDKDLERAPVASFAETTFNFGNIQQGEKVSYDFVLTNNGQTDLEIRTVRASCGCTAIAPEQTTIHPGESTKIAVTFNSEGKKGTQNKTITVITNDPNNYRVVLWIKGEVAE